MRKHVFFDLDGTLTESGEGIMNSVRHALTTMGEPVPEDEALRHFIGPPLEHSFAEVCGFTPEKAQRACDEFRVYFRERGMFENRPYPGIPEVLQALADAGFALYIATSKPQPLADAIVDHFGLRPFFISLHGSALGDEAVPKAEILHKALEDNGVFPADAIMVGDRKYDMIAAKANNVDALGVLYGYGSEEELAAAGAKRIAPDVPSLLPILEAWRAGIQQTEEW